MKNNITKCIIAICIVYVATFSIIQINASKDDNYVSNNNDCPIVEHIDKEIKPIEYNCQICGRIYYKCSHLNTPGYEFDSPVERIASRERFESIINGTYKETHNNKVIYVEEDATVKELKKLNNNIQELKRYIEYGY